MPACPRDNQYSSSPPPGFSEDNSALKRTQLIELLEKVIDKCNREPQFITQQRKQTDLLVSIAQFALLSTPISPDDKRDFLNNIISIGQDLLTDENQVNDEITLPIESTPPLNEVNETTSNVFPSSTPSNDGDEGFSLSDLADEYLQDEPTSSNDKSTTPGESADDLSKTYLSSPPSTPPTSVLSNLVFPPLSNQSLINKDPLESILFSNRLSSHDAADNADCIWKEESSPFGQMFCTKTNEIQPTLTKQISTCLLDRSLYERLTRLISRLPKQCIRNSVQQLPFRHNGQQQQNRPPRPNTDMRRPSNRPSFQQNSFQAQSMQRYPPNQNIRQYTNTNYPNQQGYPGGYYVDRRSQQQNRYPPPPNFVQYPGDHQQNSAYTDNSYGGGGHPQQKKKPPSNNQRNTKKGSGGGNKLTNEKSGAPGSGPSLNPK